MTMQGAVRSQSQWTVSISSGATISFSARRRASGSGPSTKAGSGSMKNRLASILIAPSAVDAVATSRATARTSAATIRFISDLLRVGGHATSRAVAPRPPRSRGGRSPASIPRVSPASVRCSREKLGRFLLVQGLLVDLQDRLVLRRDREGDHARNEPLGPHLVDLGLEVLHVLVGEVREPALPLEVLVDGLALLASFGDL